MIGIDVSVHNGDIDWKTASKHVDFVMIRAGYGNGNIDGRAKQNVEGCLDYKIPFGLYWFSYALNEEMCKHEAKCLCDFASKYRPLFPLCFDWEYDSDSYASKQSAIVTNDRRKRFAMTFLTEVEKRGYYAMLYTNIDYLDKGFDEVAKEYDIWLAQWGVKKPSRACGIWQKTCTGSIEGISGPVDINETSVDYPSIIKGMKENTIDEGKKQYDLLMKKYKEKYITVATDIIAGKYGNGDERKRKLKEAGYDYSLAQAVVNLMLGFAR